jgi:hypothetical protein
MKKKLKAWLNILILTVILIVPGLVFATTTTSILNTSASPTDRLNKAAVSYGPFSGKSDENTLTTTLGTVINVVLSLLGVIFIFIFISALIPNKRSISF